jgi:hypothetical protein
MDSQFHMSINLSVEHSFDLSVTSAIIAFHNLGLDEHLSRESLATLVSVEELLFSLADIFIRFINNHLMLVYASLYH